MKVLVTGGSGQLGSEVVRLLASTDNEIVTPDREAMDFLRPDRVAQVWSARVDAGNRRLEGRFFNC